MLISVIPSGQKMSTTMHLGTIALDIDGTITDHRQGLSDEVAMFFSGLYKAGWQFIFITGREFVYAMNPLSKLDFPFYLAVQNGADLIKMPEHEHIKSFYFDESVVLDLEKLRGDFLLYAGYEQGDFCYYRPHLYSEEMKVYLQAMQKRTPVPWRAVEQFKISSQKTFPMVKIIGLEKDFLGIEVELLKKHSLNCVVIKDPKAELYYYLLITDYRASKKESLAHFLNRYQLPRPLIVAGDDYNDKESIAFGDIKIVMENAPASLKAKADVIAPLSIHQGIIKGLNQAFELSKQEDIQKRWA
jgi:HAD superfamily hydrolase (TIGR01484 family)